VFVTGLRCTICGHHQPPDSGEYTCPSCGPRGIREVEFDYPAVRRILNQETLTADPRRNVLRYAPLLPIPDGAPVSPLEVGWTPILDAPRLASDLGVGRLAIKDDGRLPTASFKDRASFVGTARAASLGQRGIAAASTGNAATSLAGLSASMGLDAYIFVPASAPEAKIAQLLVYGARVFLVNADYDRTYDLCQESVARFGWYNRSAAVNPYLCEGKKTCGHEIGEQLAASLPDWVAMSVGDGCSIASTYKGLVEMREIGVIDHVPRMLAVQAEGAAPLAKAFKNGTERWEPVVAETIADSIRVGTPRNPLKALRAVRASGGTFVEVSDASILEWLPRLARRSGVFAEPTAVAALAGIHVARSRGIIGPRESVLHVVTGSGLKDVKGAMKSVAMPARIEPSIESVERALTT
jgi:threonine synthase